MSKRRATVLAVAGLTLGCVVPAAPADAASARQDRVERAVVHKVNAIRHAHGLRALRRSRALSRSADAKAAEVLRTDFFSHRSPDGSSMMERMSRYVHARRMGETLGATTRRRGQASIIVRSWMRSPSHRDALLSPGFGRVGVGRRRGRLGGARMTVIALNLASFR